MDMSAHYLIASYDGCHARSTPRLINRENMVVLLAGQFLTLVFNTWISWILSTFHLICLLFILPITMDAELLLCIIATLS